MLLLAFKIVYKNFYKKIYSEVIDLDIGLLINNVGVLTVREFYKTSYLDQKLDYY